MDPISLVIVISLSVCLGAFLGVASAVIFWIKRKTRVSRQLEAQLNGLYDRMEDIFARD